MDELPIPVWIVRQKRVDSPPLHEPCSGPNHVTAFSRKDRAMGFMAAREAGEWQVYLLTSAKDLLVLISDLHAESVPGLCVNPENDGSGGVSLSLRALIVQLEKLRGDVSAAQI